MRQEGVYNELELMAPAVGVVAACMAGEYDEAIAIAGTVANPLDLTVAIAGLCGGLLEAYEDVTGADRWAILQECALP